MATLKETRGRKRRTSPELQDELGKTSFKWDMSTRMLMDECLRSNYENYKECLTSGKKITFLRKMHEVLELNCNDVQLKNGFAFFIKKYDEIRQKLNSSGFGIDPEKDSSLNKDWILKQCPYFELLDEVTGQLKTKNKSTQIGVRSGWFYNQVLPLLTFLTLPTFHNFE